MLEVKQLCAGYSGKQILQDVSMTIPAGKVTVILGPNGCGKSTLLKALCGILPASRGQVLLDQEDVLALPPRLLAQKMAYLAQGRNMPDITVARLVLHGRFPYLSYPRRYRQEDYAIARAAMAQMGIAELADTPLQKLSGGQRQQVYIAMALAQSTPAILLDEPTTYLDIAHQLQLMHQIRQLANGGKTVVMVLHDLPLAFQNADHLILMNSGSIVSEGTPEEIYASGLAEAVFGIQLSRAHTGSGWRYFCEEKP